MALLLCPALGRRAAHVAFTVCKDVTYELSPAPHNPGLHRVKANFFHRRNKCQGGMFQDSCLVSK